MQRVRFPRRESLLSRLLRAIARWFTRRPRRFTVDARDPEIAEFVRVERIGAAHNKRFGWRLVVKDGIEPVRLTLTQLLDGPSSSRFRNAVALMSGRLAPPLRRDAWWDVLARLPRVNLEDRRATARAGAAR